MAMTALHNGVNILHHASTMMDSAARDLAQESIQPHINNDHRAGQSSTVNTANVIPHAPTSVDPTAALVKLEHASQYSRVGANVLQKEQDTIGSLLDIRV